MFEEIPKDLFVYRILVHYYVQTTVDMTSVQDICDICVHLFYYDFHQN